MSLGESKPSVSHTAIDRYTTDTYLNQNPSWGVEDSAWKARQVEKILKRNKLQPQTFGEIGCGSGEILKQLSLVYPRAEFAGYEVSPHATAVRLGT